MNGQTQSRATHRPVPTLERGHLDGVQVVVKDITPDDARAMLTRIAGNQRRISPSVVGKYARTMTLGLWRMGTGDAFRVLSDGSLVDGQHRLAACARSGVTLREQIVVVVEPGAMDAMDMGKGRTVIDILRVRESAAPANAVIAALVFEQSDFDPNATRYLGKLDRAEVILRADQGLVKWLESVRGKSLIPAGSLAVAARCFKRHPSEAADFFGALYRNEPFYGGVNFRAMSVYFQWFASSRGQGKHGQQYLHQCAYRTAQVWNVVVIDGGDTGKLLPYRPEGPIDVRVPT